MKIKTVAIFVLKSLIILNMMCPSQQQASPCQENSFYYNVTRSCINCPKYCKTCSLKNLTSETTSSQTAQVNSVDLECLECISRFSKNQVGVCLAEDTEEGDGGSFLEANLSLILVVGGFSCCLLGMIGCLCFCYRSRKDRFGQTSPVRSSTGASSAATDVVGNWQSRSAEKLRKKELTQAIVQSHLTGNGPAGNESEMKGGTSKNDNSMSRLGKDKPESPQSQHSPGGFNLYKARGGLQKLSLRERAKQLHPSPELMQGHSKAGASIPVLDKRSFRDQPKSPREGSQPASPTDQGNRFTLEKSAMAPQSVSQATKDLPPNSQKLRPLPSLLPPLKVSKRFQKLTQAVDTDGQHPSTKPLHSSSKQLKPLDPMTHLIRSTPPPDIDQHRQRGQRIEREQQQRHGDEQHKGDERGLQPEPVFSHQHNVKRTVSSQDYSSGDPAQLRRPQAGQRVDEGRVIGNFPTNVASANLSGRSNLQSGVGNEEQEGLEQTIPFFGAEIQNSPQQTDRIIERDPLGESSLDIEKELNDTNLALPKRGLPA